MPVVRSHTEQPKDESAATFAVRPDDTSADHWRIVRPMLPVELAEPPEWAPFLPIPGTYQHPVYGELDFSPEAYDRIVSNFKTGVYQDRIPVNTEHDMPSSGAVGWITDMRLGDGGAVDVRVEWNERGKSLIADDRFRYVSAEVWDTWTDPVTGTEYPDVATGLAICTNPYFKESVLRPLAASEAVIRRVSATEQRAEPETAPAAEAETPKEEPVVSGKEELTEQPEKKADPIVTELNEATRTEVTQLRERESKALAEAKQLAEENVRLRAAARVNRFTDEVRGKSEHNGTAYIGHIPDHVKMLCNLAEKFGLDSWEVTFYQEQNRAHSEQMRAGNLYREIGTGRGTDTQLTAEDQIDALANELAKAKGISKATAYTEVMNSNTELRSALARERRGA